MERALVRWFVATLVALVSTFVVLAALGSVGSYEVVVVLTLALAISWYFIVHRANRRG